MIDKDGEWVPLRVLVVNTHVGLLLMSAVRWLLQRDWYHVVLLQECGSPTARAKLRLVFPLLTWRLVGMQPPSMGPGSSGTIIATRRKRLKLRSSSNTLLTRQRFVNGKRDRFHPERRLTRGEYHDRRTKHELMLSSLHPWHIKGGPQPVIEEHDRQVRAYAQAAELAHADELLAVLGGDMNETRERGVARIAFENAELRTVSWEHIDGLWVSRDRDVRVHSVEHVDLSHFPGGEPQHDAIAVTLLLRVL